MTSPAGDKKDISTMKALVFHGSNKLALEDRLRPTLKEATDAIVRITTTTICRTDLHILKGDVSTISDGRILDHEGVEIIEEAGKNVLNFHRGDKVLIPLITSCGRCGFCKKTMYSHCRNGGWLLGNRIDGTQAEDAKKLVSHRFKLPKIMKAYDTFANAAKEHAVKVVIKNGVGAT